MAAAKDKMIELIRALPGDATVEDVTEEIYFKLHVDERLAEYIATSSERYASVFARQIIRAVRAVNAHALCRARHNQ